MTYQYGVQGGRELWDCGHVTGHVWKGGSKLQRGGDKLNVLSQSPDLTKLNLKYQMNYS